MSQEKILFEKALRRATLYWKFTGMQIDYNKKPMKKSFLDHLRTRWFYIGNFICLTSGITSVFGIMQYLSIQTILYMTPCMTYTYLGNVKSFYFLYYEDIVCDLINTLRKLQATDNSEGKDKVNKEFVKKRLPFLKVANNSILYMSYMGVATFCVGPLIIISWQYWKTNEIKLFLPFFMWYPFDQYRLKGWLLAYVHQFWSVFIAVFYVYGPDCFFFTASAFIHNQYRSLQFDMQKICQKSFDDSFNTQIVPLIHRHRELIRCVEMLNAIYGKSTLFNVLSSSFIICLAGFNVTAIHNLLLMAPFAVTLFLGFVQIFLFCYYGDLLMRSSMEVSDAIYNSKWYEMNISERKFCLFVLMRSQQPCKVTAFGFSDINLTTFARILSTAWSYFTLLNSMYSK